MNNVVNQYLKEIGNYPILSSEQEKELSINIQESIRDNSFDNDSYDKLVNSNLRLVINIAKKYKGYGLEYEDLIGEGNMGLMYAAKNYNGKSGFKFSSYAIPCIESYILLALHNKAREIRIPAHYYQDMSIIKKAKKEYLCKYNKEASNDDIANMTNIDIKRIVDLNNIFKFVKSLDEQIDEGLCLHETIASDIKTPLEMNETEDLKLRLLKALSELDERERFVIESRMGFKGKEYTLKEIGEKLNISRERARQIESKSLDKLKIIVSKYGIDENSINFT